jgi:hypothetical protein
MPAILPRMKKPALLNWAMVLSPAKLFSTICKIARFAFSPIHVRFFENWFFRIAIFCSAALYFYPENAGPFGVDSIFGAHTIGVDPKMDLWTITGTQQRVLENSIKPSGKTASRRC